MTSLTLFFLLLKKHSNCQSWLCTFPYSNFSWHIEHNKFWLLVAPRQPSFLTVTALTLPSAPPLLLPITLVLKNVLHVAWRLIAYRHWVSVIAVTAAPWTSGVVRKSMDSRQWANRVECSSPAKCAPKLKVVFALPRELLWEDFCSISASSFCCTPECCGL